MSVLEDQFVTIELDVDNVAVEWKVFFDYNYTPSYTAPHSGTSNAQSEDEPEMYEFYTFEVEQINGMFEPLDDKYNDMVISAINEAMEGEQ